MDARRRDEAKVGTLARSATTQTPHLMQPDQVAPLSRDRGSFGPVGDVSLLVSLCRRVTAHLKSPGRACET